MLPFRCFATGYSAGKDDDEAEAWPMGWGRVQILIGVTLLYYHKSIRILLFAKARSNLFGKPT